MSRFGTSIAFVTLLRFVSMILLEQIQNLVSILCIVVRTEIEISNHVLNRAMDNSRSKSCRRVFIFIKEIVLSIGELLVFKEENQQFTVVFSSEGLLDEISIGFVDPKNS